MATGVDVNRNLQNIPVRSELGRQVRRAFVAGGADRILLAADYSQIELRFMAHLSGDEAMRQAFWERQDIHDFTARKIFDIGPFADVTPNQRRMAKSVNFGLLYGMSDFGLAQRLEIERAPARDHQGSRALPGRARLYRPVPGRPRARLRRDDPGAAALHAGPRGEELRAALGGRARSDQRPLQGSAPT